MNALASYSAARQAIAEITRIDEAISLRDEMEHVKLHARQVQDRSLMADATEIQMRAERRLGELLTKGAEAGQIGAGRPKKNGTETEPFPKTTLRELNVDKKLSSRAQRTASMPAETFQQTIDGMREKLASNSAILVNPVDVAIKESRDTARKAFHVERTIEGCSAFDLLALGASGYRAGAIMADPPWQFMTRSSKGNNRAAANHYGTKSFEDIASLPISKLTADDCVLFLWVMDWDENLEMARAVMSAWGFSHKTTAFTWAKQNPGGEGFHMGQGYWTRANPEACLLATKGEPKRLHADVRQLIVSPVMDHSRKPDEAYKSIERLVGGPYLELYGRRIRPNWTVWGNEIERGQFMRSEVQERAVREAEDAVAAPVTRAVEAIVSRLTPVKIVNEALNRLGGDPKQERIDSARRLRKEGKSIREICAELKASTSTVHAWLDEHGGAEKKRLRDAARHRRKGAA